MRPGKREVGQIVIKVRQCCGHPGVFAMAGHTIGTKTSLLVVRIAGLIIVGLVTPHTCVWCIVIITIMAGGTIIGNACMSTI